MNADSLDYVEKSPSNNIHLYMDLPLKDPVCIQAARRLSAILGTTFWRNMPAMTATLSAICLAMRGYNIDRAFMHFGSGGAGQSLVTALIDALFPGLHGYIDMNIYYTDDELRKQGDLLEGKIISTGQETVQGAARPMRLDLFKKHISADPVAMRLLYSIVTRMVELTGMKRFEMNKLPDFGDVEEAVFNSILRRSLVIKHEARFVERDVLQNIENADAKGIFLKDPTAKEFVRSGPAITAGWKMLHGHMAQYTTAQCYNHIEQYVDRFDGGLTRRCMRLACRLPVEVHGAGAAASSEPAPAGDPVSGFLPR